MILLNNFQMTCPSGSSLKGGNEDFTMSWILRGKCGDLERSCEDHIASRGHGDII